MTVMTVATSSMIYKCLMKIRSNMTTLVKGYGRLECPPQWECAWGAREPCYMTSVTVESLQKSLLSEKVCPVLQQHAIVEYRLDIRGEVQDK